MRINWKVRAKNPIFWVQIVLAIVMPLIVGMGYEWSQMTTWQTLGNTILAALQNPVIFVTMLVSVWNAVNDPTTSGVTDSIQAMTYDVPKRDEEASE